MKSVHLCLSKSTGSLASTTLHHAHASAHTHAATTTSAAAASASTTDSTFESSLREGLVLFALRVANRLID